MVGLTIRNWQQLTEAGGLVYEVKIVDELRGMCRQGRRRMSRLDMDEVVGNG